VESPLSDMFDAGLLDQVEAGVVVYGPDLRVVAANRQAGRLLGQVPELLTGTRFQDLESVLVREDESPISAEDHPVHRAFVNRGPVRDVTVGAGPAGSDSRRWLLMNALPEFDEDDGGLRRVVLTITDVTGARRAEDRVLHLSALLHAMRELERFLSSEKDRDTLVTGACRLLTETRGYRSAWVAFRDHHGRLQVVGEAGIGADFAPLRAQLEAGEWPLCCERALRQTDVLVVRDVEEECAGCGLDYAARGGAALVRGLDCAGRGEGALVVELFPGLADDEEERLLFHQVSEGIVAALCALEDDKERGRMQRVLRESDERLLAVLEHAQDAIFIHAQGIISYANPAAVALFGAASREALLGSSVVDRIAPQYQAVVKERIRALEQERRRAPRLEERVVRFDGTEVDVEIMAVPYEYLGRPGALVFAHDITERKAAVTALRQRLELLDQLARIAASVPGMIFSFMLRPDGSACLPFATRVIEDLWGLRPEDVREDFTPGFDRIHADDLARVGESINESAETLAPWQDSFRVLHPEKGELWLEARSVPRPEPDGSVVWHGFVEDVTERKRAEEAVRTLALRLQAALASSTDAIFVVDSSAQVVQSNDAFATFNKFADVKEMPGSADAGVQYMEVSQEGRVIPFEEWGVSRALRGEVGRNVRYDLRRKDTGETWVGSFSYAPIRGSDGAILGAIVIGRDITDQILSEQALRDSEERFRTVVESAPDGIIVHVEGQVGFLNTAMARLLGAPSPDELIGCDISSFIAPENHGAVEALGRKELGVGASPAAMEQEYVRLDGTRVPVETMSVRFQFRERPAELVFVRDRTERRRAETERAHLQEQLLQAQKMESIGQLAGGVAHDFNNILTVQKGYCEIMKMKLREGDPLAEGVAQIEACTDRATALTRQLLAFSRKQTLQPKVLDLNELVRNMNDMLRRLIGEDVDLVTVLDRDPAMIMADPGQIEQVLVNLVVNARDAMPGGGRLRVEVSQVALSGDDGQHSPDVVPGPYVVLSVTDSGHGMDAAIAKRIFEPFFTTKGEGKGTGLGLSTVYGIVRQSGGDVRVRSEVGRGTTFSVYLPRVDVEKKHTTSGGDVAATLGHGQGQSVLVVEDEPALRGLAVLMIERLGYKVAEAADGAEALMLIERQGLQPDVLLTDVVIPGMVGPALAEELRERVPGLKTIYMSGYSDDAVSGRDVLGPDVDFLQKPFTVSDLARAIGRVLGAVPAVGP